MGEEIEMTIAGMGTETEPIETTEVPVVELSEAEIALKAKLDEREMLMNSLRGKIYGEDEAKKNAEKEKRRQEVLKEAEIRREKEIMQKAPEPATSERVLDSDDSISPFGVSPENIVIGKRTDYDPIKGE